MLKTENIFPIGIGTWGIGGFAERDPHNNDTKQVKALKYMFDRGMNYADLCYFYSEGRAVELLHEALAQSKIDRSDLFLSAAIYPYKNESLKDVQDELDLLLKMFDTKYMDSILFTGSSLPKWGLNNVFKYKKELLAQKTVRFVSATNLDLETLKKYKAEFGDNFFAHELHYSLEIRANEEFGLTKYADQNNIRNVVFQPIRRNKTAQRNWPLLVELSKKYKKTQNQILLNWILSRGMLPLIKSEDISHIDEALGSLDFKIAKVDIDRLNEFTPPNWETPRIDWGRTGNGVLVHNLPNIFDEEYDKILGKLRL